MERVSLNRVITLSGSLQEELNLFKLHDISTDAYVIDKDITIHSIYIEKILTGKKDEPYTYGMTKYIDDIGFKLNAKSNHKNFYKTIHFHVNHESEKIYCDEDFDVEIDVTIDLSEGTFKIINNKYIKLIKFSGFANPF
jgi:hypothetical protein